MPACSTSESRVLITCDADFGELAFASGLPAPSGVILVRVPTTSLDAFVDAVMVAMFVRDDWLGHFSVIEPGRIRMTPLPARTGD